MSPAARWTTIAWVPLFATTVACAWYGARSVTTLYLIEEGGLEIASLGSLRIAQGLAAMVGMLLAGGIALIAGPWVPAILGAAVLACGIGAAAVLPPEAGAIALVAASLGHGMIWPSLYGAVARALRGERESLRVATFFLAYLAINAGSFVVTFATQGAREIGYRAVFGASGGVAALAFVLAAAMGVVVLATRRSAEEDPPAPARAPHLAAVAALVVVAAVPWIAALQAMDAWHTLVPDFFDRFGDSTPFLFAINPVVVIALTAILALTFLVLHALRARVPALAFAGAGLAVVGVAAVLTVAVVGPEVSLGALATAAVVSAIGEALFLAPFLSRLAGDLPHRLETAVIALWSLVTRGLGMAIAPLVAEEPALRALLWLGGLSAVVAGVGLAIAAFPLRRVFAPATT